MSIDRPIGCATLSFLLLLLTAGDLWGQPDQQENPLSFDRNIQGLLGKYCYRCHHDEKPSGGVDLKSDHNPRLIAQNSLTWRTALELLNSNEMPPAGDRQPSDEERKLIGQFIELTVADFDCSTPRDPGTPTLRRLNRVEYDHSIGYLTGLELHLSENFPEDTISFGFRNIAQSLTLSPLHVDQYFTSARRVVNEVLSGAGAEATDVLTPQQNAYRLIYFDTPVTPRDDRVVASRIISRFATRAFRRDVDDALLEKWMLLYDVIRTKGESHDAAVGHLLTAVLISPRFLMRSEQQQPGVDGPFPVDPFDLASRISFFLWSSPPDDRLLGLARDQTLRNPEVLETQVRRMLADPRSDALVKNFFYPWLQIDSLGSHRPDSTTFPQWDEGLQVSITEEPRQLLTHMLRQDRPITELIDASYTFVNATLASHYGLQMEGDIDPQSFRQIALGDRRRGGLLTTSAVLMAQSDPTRTNVPRRGNFIAAAILGTAPPPPPADVPPLAEDEQTATTLTLRERFVAHRADPQCASCHSKIDPLGFALENYDAIGQWRQTEVGKPIDASGELPDGRQFNGPIELKDILLENKEGLTRVLASQMLIYALGRGPIQGDECVIDDIVKSMQNHDYRLSEIVLGIVNSYPFQHTRNPDF